MQHFQESNQNRPSIHLMISNDYLVEMTFTPFGSLLSLQEVATFSERFVLPTFEPLQKLRDAGRIIAGGTALAAVGFIFIARVDSPQQLEDMVSSLPLWARAQTRVVPLGTFESRLASVQRRLSQAAARTQDPVVAGQNN